ncbi:MAG: hypothetical protein J6Y08_11015 [Clostridiales bacterium]|nr:hypothetical protein [Clostridiales bacterium]
MSQKRRKHNTTHNESHMPKKIHKAEPEVVEEEVVEERPAPKPARFRIGGRIILGLVFTGMTVFMCYLIYIQYGIQHDQYEYYSHMASDIHWRRIEDIPERGDILDCNGNVLASTTYEYTIGMTPSDVLKSQEGRKEPQSKEQIAAAFAEYVGADEQKMLEWLDMTDKPYIQIIKKVTYSQMKALSTYISDNRIGGIKIDPVPKRYYTYDNLAAQVLGFADQSDNTLIGQYGIEAYYDDELSGSNGYTYAEVDNYNQSALPYSAPTSIAAMDGYNVQLTLDMNIQRIAENACRDAYNEYHPREGVTCIVMDPYTGEIKAMVSIPDFNLNSPREMPFGVMEISWNSMNDEQRTECVMNVWRNRCISDTYEPGSTMKAVTTAIALEEGLTYEEEIFSDAPIEVSSIHTISCWREKKQGNHGYETLREAFERSCNPIFVQLADRIGIKKYYNYIRNCGFYECTGVDLPMEGKGIFHDDPQYIDMATLSFGESSTVTPLQLITVYSALVNGGSLMRPHIASRIIDNEGNIIREFEPEKIRTLFSEGTSARVRSLFEAVVSEGTGSSGYVPGYYVAGKTSTSTIDVGQETGMHVLSFGCYAPSFDPEIMVLVVINKPEDREVGSSAAAKVAAEIVENTLEYMGVERRLTPEEFDRMTIRYNVPDVVGMTYGAAKTKLEDAGFNVMDGFGTMSADSIVGTMYYGDEKTVYKNTLIVLYPSLVEEANMSMTAVPNFEGMNIIECMRVAKQYGLNISITGNTMGTVVSQDPQTTIHAGVTPTPTPTPTPIPDGEEDPGDSDPSDPSDPGGDGTIPPDRVPYGTVIRLTLE